MSAVIFTSYYLCPLGTIELKATAEHIISVLFVDRIEIENPNELTKLATIQLDEYFDKKRTQFDLPLQQEGTEFQLKIWDPLQLEDHSIFLIAMEALLLQKRSAP